MAVTVADVLADCRYILQDAAKVRWADAELLLWLNIGQYVIAIGKPDASTTTAAIALVAGTKQALPAGGIVLIDVIRNMGTGSTPGRAVRREDKAMMDTIAPDWHTSTAGGVVHYYMVDSRFPKTFYVYPPQPAVPTYIEIVYSVAPSLAVTGGNITLDDIYRAVLLDYICYRAFSKDNEVGDAGKASFHMQAFLNSMGLKTNGDAALTLSQQAEQAMPQPAQRG